MRIKQERKEDRYRRGARRGMQKGGKKMVSLGKGVSVVLGHGELKMPIGWRWGIT